MRPLDDDLVAPRGTAWRSRTPGARRTPSPGSRGTRPSRATAAAKSIAPNTSIRGSGAYDGDEDRHALAAPLAVRPVVQRLVCAGGQQPAGVVGAPRRRPGSSRGCPGRRSAVPSGRTTSRRPSRAGSGVRDHGRDRDRVGRPRCRRPRSPSSGNDVLVDHLDEDVEDAAAGQPDRERVVVAHAVPLQHRLTGRDDLARRARRPRPRRSRPRPSRPPRRPGRPASTRRAGAAPTANVATTVPDADGLARAPPAAAAARSTSRIGDHLQELRRSVARLCPATKSSRCGSAATIPPCTGAYPGLPRCGLTQTTRCASRRSRLHLLAEQRRRRRAPTRR